MTKQDLINKIKNELTSIYSVDDLKRICGMVIRPMDVKEILSTLSEAMEDHFDEAIMVDLSSADFEMVGIEVRVTDVQMELDEEKFKQDLYDLFVTENNEDKISDWIKAKDFPSEMVYCNNEKLQVIGVKNELPLTKETVIDIINNIPDEIIAVMLSDDQVNVIYNHINKKLNFDGSCIEVWIDSDQRLKLQSIDTNVSWSIYNLERELNNL